MRMNEDTDNNYVNLPETLTKFNVGNASKSSQQNIFTAATQKTFPSVH